MSRDVKYLILPLFLLTVIFALPLGLFLIHDSGEWKPYCFGICLEREEIALPDSQEIDAVIASVEFDDNLSFKAIPPFELPKDIGIRLVNTMRPVVTFSIDEFTHKLKKEIAPLKLKIQTRHGKVVHIDVLAHLGLQRAVLIVDGREGIRGGNLERINELVQLEEGKPPERSGDFSESLNIRGIVRAVYDSIHDGSDQSDDIEASFLHLDASSGRRPVEELDAWRERHAKDLEVEANQ